MRIKDGFVVKEIVGNIVIIPVGQATMDSFRPTRMIEEGMILTKFLIQEMDREAMINAYSEYAGCDRDVSIETVDGYIEYAKERGFIELYETKNC